IRSAAQFVILMPGVTTGAGNNGFDARFNGGLQSSDEAVIDGVTMQDAMNSQGGMTEAFTDHPISPETGWSVNASVMPPWLFMASCIVTPSITASSLDCNPPLKRASKPLLPAPVVTPGIRITNCAAERM